MLVAVGLGVDILARAPVLPPALVVSGVLPSYVMPEVDVTYGIALPVTARDVDMSLEKVCPASHVSVCHRVHS